MGIATRAGVARTLEYNKKDDRIISKTESYKRIIIMLLMLTFLFCFTIQILILITFQNIHDRIQNTYIKVPKLNYHLQLISKNGSVFRFPIIQSSNNSLTTGPFIKTFSFPKKVDIKFGYHYREDSIYFHGLFNKNHMFVSINNYATNLKNVQEKYLISNKLDIYYFLPENVSWVDIGDNILLYGIS